MSLDDARRLWRRRSPGLRIAFGRMPALAARTVWGASGTSSSLRQPVIEGGDERVQDDGIGIPPEMLPRVFDLFAQDERALGRARGGLGIGLALVQSLIQLHGGTSSVESEPGKGSTFTVKLPTAIGPEVPAQDAARILH